ncbi:hypothetical protein FACUT_4023 [Fusarium acutatum]|uniref:Uncharacterized protein n=1 Tax=Fusarium acutatum TaxID=78861 RepID=A0A8H4JX15_9HYPO|nr:hypothetical protein FACUT_4023 [Fusarium acutatum]
MGKYWLGEKSTYPVPNLDHTSQHESHPGRDGSCLPCTARLSSRRSQIRQPENRHPYRPSEPTSNSTKTNWPTLDRLPHTPSTAGPRIDPRIDQDRAAYPAPSNTQPCQTRRNRIPPSPTRLPCTARPETTHRKKPTTPTSLQKSGEPIGEIEAKDGLPSADRNNKATLLLTGPFRTAKSSAKDLTPLVLKLQYAKYHDALRAPWKNRLLRR